MTALSEIRLNASKNVRTEIKIRQNSVKITLKNCPPKLLGVETVKQDQEYFDQNCGYK